VKACRLFSLAKPGLCYRRDTAHVASTGLKGEPAKGFEPLAYGLRNHFLVFVSFYEKPLRLLSWHQTPARSSCFYCLLLALQSKSQYIKEAFSGCDNNFSRAGNG
jgi:hypothetical protein